MSRYPQAYDGEWFRLPLRAFWWQMCCDCHKVHRWQFRIKRDGLRLRLEARCWTDGPATGGARSKMGVVDFEKDE